MPTVKIRNENGTVVTQELLSRRVAVFTDEFEFSGVEEDNSTDDFDIDFDEQEGIFYPAVAEEVEYDHEGAVSSITSTCGETENRRESDEQPDITIQGVLTESQLPEIKALKEGEQTTVISDVHSGRVLVKRVTITQSTDVIDIRMNGETELAFTFQLQLGQPNGN